MKKIYIKSLLIILISFCGITLIGQNKTLTSSIKKYEANDSISKYIKPKKSWEIGVGGALINWSRISAYGLINNNEGYSYDVSVRHILGGGLISIARELNPWFYLDLQGTIGVDKDKGTQKLNLLYMGGLGVQFRLSPLFESKYVEPYFRLGVNYLYKDFHSPYSGKFQNDPTKLAKWNSTDIWNTSGAGSDKNYAIPVSIGVGINSWITNNFGFGLQGEYLIPIEKNRPRFAQVSAKLMWRFGGKSKSPAPIVQPVVEKREVIIEKPVEKIIEKKIMVPILKNIYEYLDCIYFDFNKATIKPESEDALNHIADILKHFHEIHYLIIGHTDSIGSQWYNQRLSEKRAKAVCDALIKRGIPKENLKYIGNGKKSAILSPTTSNSAREGDRKVMIEFVKNMDYWNSIK